MTKGRGIYWVKGYFECCHTLPDGRHDVGTFEDTFDLIINTSTLVPPWIISVHVVPFANYASSLA